MSLVASLIARLKATMVSPTHACLTASGIFSYSLSSPTQRNLPSPHWASKSSLKFRSAIGGHCIVSLPFRQLPATDQNQEGKDRIGRDERDGEKRRRKVEGHEREKADEILRGGKNEEARRFLMRFDVGLAEGRSKRYRVRHRHYYYRPQRVIRRPPQDNPEECSREAKPVKRRYLSMAFDYRQNGDAEHCDCAHARNPCTRSRARENLREERNPHQESECEPGERVRLGRSAEYIPVVRHVTDEPHHDRQNAENDFGVAYHTFSFRRRMNNVATRVRSSREMTAGKRSVVSENACSATIENIQCGALSV